MKKNITYLFGAGASFGNGEVFDLQSYKPQELEGIPVVKGFNIHIANFLDFIKFDLSIYNPTEKEQLTNFHKRFKSVFDEMKYIYSFDTYAKKLYELGDDSKLSELKFFVNSFIIFRQLVANRDMRYDLFFAVLMKNKALPENVNYFSWNYDTQIEMSLSSLTKSHRFSKLINRNLENKMIDCDKPVYIKLNGYASTGHQCNSGVDLIEIPYNTPWDLNAIKSKFLNLLLKNDMARAENNIKFSWERIESTLKNKTVTEIIENTNILVVIGYSFPTINRTIDRIFLNKLKENTQIYVQVKGDFEDVKSRIEALKFNEINTESLNIKEIDSYHEFYIPFEID